MSSKDIQLALKLMGVMGMYKKFHMALQNMQEGNPIFVAAKNAVAVPGLANDINEVFIKGVVELTEATAVIYAETFNKKELKKMIKFYKSSVGKKFVDKLLHIEEEVLKASTIWMTKSLSKITDIVLVYSNRLSELKDKMSSAIPVSTKLH